MPPLFDVRQALQDKPDYDALSHDSPVEPPGAWVIEDETALGHLLDARAGRNRHGEEVNLEPEDREGWDATCRQSARGGTLALLAVPVVLVDGGLQLRWPVP
jgi:hypothetical protein